MPGMPWINKRKGKAQPYITREQANREADAMERVVDEQRARQAMKRGKTPQAANFANQPPAQGNAYGPPVAPAATAEPE